MLEYFDAHLIGLTATPSKQTIGFFDGNLVMEYNHERAVADGVNVGYNVYRIKTEVTEQGGRVEAGFHVDKRNRLDRATRWQQLDEDFEYEARQLDRSVVVPSRIRTVLQAFRDALPALFDQRAMVPKTLVFAKDDSHAEDIVRIAREVFGRGNDFCKKDHLHELQPRDDAAREAQDDDRDLSQQPDNAHRRDGRHDRHRHRHQAARMPALHAQREEPRVLRADEGSRHPHREPDRAVGRQRRRREGVTRSLKHFIGQTPAPVVRGEGQLSLLYNTAAA